VSQVIFPAQLTGVEDKPPKKDDSKILLTSSHIFPQTGHCFRVFKPIAHGIGKIYMYKTKIQKDPDQKNL
jgi:hypothetical protein